jgi:hypothetical protein
MNGMKSILMKLIRSGSIGFMVRLKKTPFLDRELSIIEVGIVSMLLRETFKIMLPSQAKLT